jgi:predicted dehydrogenase
MSHESRRTFLGRLAAGSVLAAGAPSMLSTGAHPVRPLRRRRRRSPNDEIQIAIIGAGGMGTIDVNTALDVEGVKLVAVCDLYDGRLEKAKEAWSKQGEEDEEVEVELFMTKDYREILARDEVDAVIVATPDHWHRQISIDAMRAGKAVYCEKPMVHAIGEGRGVIDVQRETGRTFQVGSQGMASLGNEKAKQLLADGAIGVLTYAEGFWARNSPGGAWQYEIPEDASEETVDWDRFLGSAPHVPFDATRFFRWRNYRDYGTGVSGDLFVHLFSSLHFIANSLGPTRIMATGGLRFWKDGRDVPDVMLGMFDYPETDTHPPFNLSLRVNFVDGTSGSTVLRLVGTEGALDIGWTEVTLRRNRTWQPTDELRKQQEDERAARYGERKQMLPPAEAVYKAEERYWGAHKDHFINFFEGMRTGETVPENAVFGFRAAAPALLCNDSYFDEEMIRWDPVNMRVVE